MRKAKLSVHISDVKSVIKSFAVEVSASSLDELKDSDLQLLLKKAMGANYDRYACAWLALKIGNDSQSFLMNRQSSAY